MNPDEFANKMAMGIAQMREMLAPVDEATLGYRRQLEEQGWSPAAAEEMAVEFYSAVMAMVSNPAHRNSR